MVWVKKISPYLLLLFVVIWSRPNAIGTYTMSSEPNSHSLTAIPKSADFTGFNQNVTLDGNSIANITGSLQLENTTSPTMYIGKRYLLNATITVQSWGTDVDRIYDIKFILQLLDTGSNILNSLERETYTEINYNALNQSVHTVVIFTISKEDIQTPEMVVAAKTVLFWKEGRGPLRLDAETETELNQFDLDIIEGPSQVKSSPEFVLDGIQAKDGTKLRISVNISTEMMDNSFWYFGTLYPISIEIEVLEWGWDARGQVQRLHDISLILEFIGEGGVSVHTISIPTDPSEIIVINAPIVHQFSYSISEQDIKSLTDVTLSVQLQFNEELIDREEKSHQDETHLDLSRYLLTIQERSVHNDQAFSKTLTLKKGSLVNIEGVFELENTTSALLYFGKRYPLLVNITVVRWGDGVDRLHNIKLFVDIIGGGGSVLASIEQDAIPNEITDLNNPLHTTPFFRLNRDLIPTIDNIELAIGISGKEGVNNAPDVTNREEATRFIIMLIDKPIHIASSPIFSVNVEGVEGTILQVTGNIIVNDNISWFFDQKYTIQTELEVLEWGWNARGSVSRIHQIKINMDFIGEGGVSIHSINTLTDPEEIVALNAPINHNFDVSISKQNVNSMNSVTLALQLSFIEAIQGLNTGTPLQDVTKFPLKLEDAPTVENDNYDWLKYGGFLGLIVIISILGRKLLRKREDEYWLK